VKPGNVTIGELELGPIGPPESHWPLSDLRGGVEHVVWPWTGSRQDLSDCRAERLPNRPWLLQLWEPILTKAPSPARCQPWCCYIQTVIFYHRPYIPGRWSASRWSDGRLHVDRGGFVEFDQVETRLSWDHVVRFDGDLFVIAGGRVAWRHQRWWMFRSARRKKLEVVK